MKDIVILAVVQGICEWFPISSSGHLFIIRKLIGLKPNISFDIFLHFSSLLTIIIFFRKEILKLINVFYSFDKNNPYFKRLIYIISATFITGLLGLFLKNKEELLENKIFVSSGLLFTTILLFLSDRKNGREINLRDAFLIGFFQGISLIPGISRSGSTISISKIIGIKNEDAFNFSFLIAIPAILGAVIIKLNEIKVIKFSFLITGFFVSLITSLITLYILKKILFKGNFKYFGIYTFFVFILSLFI